MRLYHDIFNLQREILIAVQMHIETWPKLEYKVIVSPAHIHNGKTSSSYWDAPISQWCDDVYVLGSDKNLTVSVIQIVTWNYVENITIYICNPFSGAVVFESSSFCEIWSANEMWSIRHVICI